MTDPWRMVGEDGLTPPQRLVEAIFRRLRQDIAWANCRRPAVQRAAALATLRFVQSWRFLVYCEVMDAEPGRIAAGLLSGFHPSVLLWAKEAVRGGEVVSGVRGRDALLDGGRSAGDLGLPGVPQGGGRRSE